MAIMMATTMSTMADTPLIYSDADDAVQRPLDLSLYVWGTGACNSCAPLGQLDRLLPLIYFFTQIVSIHTVLYAIRRHAWMARTYVVYYSISYFVQC